MLDIDWLFFNIINKYAFLTIRLFFRAYCSPKQRVARQLDWLAHLLFIFLCMISFLWDLFLDTKKSKGVNWFFFWLCVHRTISTIQIWLLFIIFPFLISHIPIYSHSFSTVAYKSNFSSAWLCKMITTSCLSAGIHWIVIYSRAFFSKMSSVPQIMDVCPDQYH